MTAAGRNVDVAVPALATGQIAIARHTFDFGGPSFILSSRYDGMIEGLESAVTITFTLCQA